MHLQKGQLCRQESGSERPAATMLLPSVQSEPLGGATGFAGAAAHHGYVGEPLPRYLLLHLPYHFQVAAGKVRERCVQLPELRCLRAVLWREGSGCQQPGNIGGAQGGGESLTSR